MLNWNNKVIFRYLKVHLRERMTVNHDVTGSSPVGGAKQKADR